MKKKLLFIIAITLPVMAATVIKAYNTNKLSLGDVSLANIEALANTEDTACSNAQHCHSLNGETCYYYVITGDHNQMINPLKDHVHRGVD